MSLLKTLAGAIIALGLSAQIAQANVYPVSVSQSGSDMVGQEIATLVTNQIAQSADLHLVGINSKVLHVQISLVSLSGAAATGYGENWSSAIAYVFSLQPSDYLVNAGVEICGSDRVQQCADMILGDLRTAIHN